MERVQPNEIYNLAAQSHVQVSFEMPDYTAQVDALGTLRFLDAIRETGIDKKTGQSRVLVDPIYFRPTEVDELLGDATKARDVLGWKPKVKFEELVNIMTIADWEKVKKRGY